MGSLFTFSIPLQNEQLRFEEEKVGLEPVLELPTEESLLELPDACETLISRLDSRQTNMIQSLNRPSQRL